MEIFQLGNGNIEVIPSVLFLRDEMNGPLSLEDLLGNLARIPLVFNKKKIQENGATFCFQMQR